MYLWKTPSQSRRGDSVDAAQPHKGETTAQKDSQIGDKLEDWQRYVYWAYSVAAVVRPWVSGIENSNCTGGTEG